MARTRNFIDYTNQKVGKLFFLEYIGGKKWKVKCDCGYEFNISTQCVREQGQKRCKYCFYNDKKIHGGAGTPEYQAWKHIKERCYDKNDMMYPNYGNRGIKMCDRWINEKDGFTNFLLDMGKRPSKEYSIDRINVDGNYEPYNCKWSTRKEQNRNKTNILYVEYKGVRRKLIELAEEYGMSTIRARDRYKRGWSIEDILMKKIRGQK